jgi:transcriptional regulator with XRE-family HTH domain
MEMQIDSRLIRLEREKRAWSQEHLATLAGLSLRTIQRIESTELASYESISAISAVLKIPVTDLRVESALSLRVKAATPKVEIPHVAAPLPRNPNQLVPYIVVAIGMILASLVGVRTAHFGWLVMAGPLLLALTLLGADVLAFRLQGKKRRPSTPTVFFSFAFLAACAIVASGDPAQVPTMIPILGSGGALTIPMRSQNRWACRWL